jgi:hypothetical protein
LLLLLLLLLLLSWLHRLSSCSPERCSLHCLLLTLDKTRLELGLEGCDVWLLSWLGGR